MIPIHPYECKFCGEVKYAKYKSWVKDYCSHTCARKANPVKGERTSVTCHNCKQEFVLLASVKRAREKNGDTIKYCSKKCESEARTYVKDIQCPICKEVFRQSRKEQITCGRICADKYIVIHGIRKGKGYWYENGYKVLYLEGDRSIKEHIKIMEEFIGRKLNSDEVVHHKNEDKLDNRIENLQLMTRGEHSRLHRLLELERGQPLFGR